MSENKITPGSLLLGAARMRAEAEGWSGDRPIGQDLARADKLEGRAREILPEALSEMGVGGELVPNGRQGLQPAEFRSTLRKPDYVAAAASRDRLDLLHDAGALEAGLDAADTAGAGNSIEQMLAHQISSAHRSTLKLTKQLNSAIERMNVISETHRAQANIEATRLANAVARLMTSGQQGALTLQRLRTGGQQVVVVQHVDVNSGGQAIVTGAIGAGDGRGGARRGQGEN